MRAGGRVRHWAGGCLGWTCMARPDQASPRERPSIDPATPLRRTAARLGSFRTVGLPDVWKQLINEGLGPTLWKRRPSGAVKSQGRPLHEQHSR